jgi:DNA-binding HxlR family transcriptional regulator
MGRITLQKQDLPNVEKEFFAARPIKPDLGVLGRKWALLILAEVGLRKVDRFSALLRSNPQLNSRVLSRRLRELEEAGMIERSEKKTAPGPVKWVMTHSVRCKMARGESVSRKTSEEALLSQEASSSQKLDIAQPCLELRGGGS